MALRSPAVLALVLFVAAVGTQANLRATAPAEVDHPMHWDLESVNSLDDVISVWHKFVTFFKKEYSLLEKEFRFGVFRDNVAYIKEVNAAARPYTLGLNQFADLTFDEFSTAYLNGHLVAGVQNSTAITGQHTVTGEAADEAVDWREKKAVSPVKNQGNCGSCWAFSTTGALESALFLKTGKMTLLSEQELVACAGGQYQNMGCRGGMYTFANKFIKDHGIASESDYPYECVDASNPACSAACDKKASANIVTKVNGYTQIPQTDESAMADAVSKEGPLSVAIQVTRNFQLYKGGVFTDDTCATQLNHAVLAVGYGTDAASGSDYWIIKNSWKASWGEEGYIRFLRGKNMCGVGLLAVYPNI